MPGVLIDADAVDRYRDATEDEWHSFKVGIADHVLHHNGGVINILVGKQYVPYTGHPCALSKRDGVTDCPHPLHDQDAAAVREFLIVLGVIPDPYPAGRSTDPIGKTIPDRGLCPHCHRTQSLTVDGVLHVHPDRYRTGDHCKGSGKQPARRPEVAA